LEAVAREAIQELEVEENERARGFVTLAETAETLGVPIDSKLAAIDRALTQGDLSTYLLDPTLAALKKIGWALIEQACGYDKSVTEDLFERYRRHHNPAPSRSIDQAHELVAELFLKADSSMQRRAFFAQVLGIVQPSRVEAILRRKKAEVLSNVEFVARRNAEINEKQRRREEFRRNRAPRLAAPVAPENLMRWTQRKRSKTMTMAMASLSWPKTMI